MVKSSTEDSLSSTCLILSSATMFIDTLVAGGSRSSLLVVSG